MGIDKRSASVSVAIVNHNGVGYLAETIDQIRAHCRGVTEILLVDNLSTDGSIGFLTTRYPDVRIIARQVNDGPGPARNIAIRSARSDLILLLDNDVAPCEDCIEYLRFALAQHPDAVVAMPAVLYKSRPGQVQFAGADSHFLGTMSLLSQHHPVDSLDMTTSYCTSIVSAAMLVDRRRLGTHELFNERLFMYLEDHEAGYRCSAYGMKLMRVPAARCLHREGTRGLSIRDIGRAHPTRLEQTMFNRWYILATLYQPGTLFRFLLAFACYEMVIVTGAIAQGWLRIWMRAAGAIVVRRSEIRARRRQVQSERTSDDSAILRYSAFPFNTETPHSRLQRAGEGLINAACRVNWFISGIRS